VLVLSTKLTFRMLIWTNLFKGIGCFGYIRGLIKVFVYSSHQRLLDDDDDELLLEDEKELPKLIETSSDPKMVSSILLLSLSLI